MISSARLPVSFARKLGRPSSRSTPVISSYHGSSSRPVAQNSLRRKQLRLSSSAVATTDPNHLPSTNIDLQISAKIEGEESQTATVRLKPGEVLRAESGAMLFMTQGVVMDTKLAGASSAFSRMLTGQNLFLTDFRYEGTTGEGTVGLGTDFPSKILRLRLEDYEESSLICQRGAFLASNPTVDIQMEFTKKLSTGFFGGQGFILQRLTGSGDVLIKAGGTLVRKELKDGETLRVTSGSIVAFTSTVQYDIQMMPGIKNVMFGGEGLFVTSLTGPGIVWLQGMPPDRMIAEIARRVPSGGPGIGIPIGGGGGGGGAGDAAGAAAGDAAAGEAAATTGGAAAGDAADAAAGEATPTSDDFAPQEGGGLSEPSEIDSESSEALFGDAAGRPSDNTSSSGQEEPSFDETSFGSEESSFGSDETTFGDDQFASESFSKDEIAPDSGGDLFEDSTVTDVFESGGAEEAAETAKSVLSTLWDLFTGGD